MTPLHKELLSKHGLGFLEEALELVALPAIALKPVDPRPGITSKFGGTPYLPKDFAWPVNGSEQDGGRPLDYLLQIRLDELGPAASEFGLPSEGMLTFFYDIEEQPWGFDASERNSWRVCYLPKYR